MDQNSGKLYEWSQNLKVHVYGLWEISRVLRHNKEIQTPHTEKLFVRPGSEPRTLF